MQASTDFASSRPEPRAADAYRMLWRWHFYAALFVAPLLIVLAITGTIYCFQPQIEPWLYRDRMVVEPAAHSRLPWHMLLERAAAHEPAGARASTATIRDDSRRSAEFVFKLPSGESESVYVNPYTGDVLGTLSVEHRLMTQVRKIHRGLLLGKPGELLMELAGCWTLVMIGTGIALWWPWRGGAGTAGPAVGAPAGTSVGTLVSTRAGTPAKARAAWLPRLSLRGRALVRDLHAVGGIWLAAGALAFVLTGLPWSGSWGKQFKALATRASLGYPTGAWGESHEHSKMPAMKMDDLPLPQTPWAVGATAVPDSHADHAHAVMPHAAPLALERVVAIAAAHGLGSGYTIALPATPSGVYTVSYFPDDPRNERTLHIDQYSGKVLRDIGYGDYGAVARAISYGTSLHMGRYFGLANQLLCAFISLGLAALAATGAWMWWLRRPRLGAPPHPRALPPMRAWKFGLTCVGAIFPLMGATLLLVFCVDRVAFARRTGA